MEAVFFLNYSGLGDVVVINNLTLHANSANAAAGGLGVNFGDFAAFDLRASQVYSNKAYEGGGLYFQGSPTFGLTSARIGNTVVYSNTASLSAGIENHSGNATVPLTLEHSALFHNRASFYGGAIGNYRALAILTTTLTANTAAVRGGGLYDYEGGTIDVEQSTLSENKAQKGGGIFSELFIHNNAALTLANSTLSGNTASQDGGGIYAQGGQIKLFNATIATNQIQVPPGITYIGLGGGIYISPTAVITASSSIIADNVHSYGALAPVPDDCHGTIFPRVFNLIQTVTSCTFVTPNFGNTFGQDPLLGPLQINGGATQTQALLTGSPAIDPAGNYCVTPAGAVLTVDQRDFLVPTARTVTSVRLSITHRASFCPSCRDSRVSG